MSNWNYIDFDFSAGMSTNKVNPGNKSAKRLLNLHNHEQPGKLCLRPGYEEKYEKPSTNTITNLGFLNFGLFYDRQANEEGQEVTCLIQRGDLQSVVSSVDETMSMLCFWIRPYWNGEEWIDKWLWLNKTIITAIDTGSDSVYPNMIKIPANATNTIEDDLNYNWSDGCLNRFTIYNKTKDEYARVISSKIDGDDIRICHTLYNSSWEQGDIVYISRNWIDLVYMSELVNVDWKEISFHNINHDLRIGFGGYQNRPGLMVGYRKKYLQLIEFDFKNLHPDIAGDDILEEFSTINEVVLDTVILNDSYGINLVSSTDEDGSLDEGDYTIRLTGILDDYSEQLLTEASSTLDDGSTLEILPYVNMGLINPRITGYGIYYSVDNETFYQVIRYNLRENKYAASSWKIDSNGRLIPLQSLNSTETDILELHKESNAASSEDTDSFGSCDVFNGGELQVTDDAYDNYALKFTSDILTSDDSSERVGLIFPLSNIEKDCYYRITAQLKMRSNFLEVYCLFMGESRKVLNRTVSKTEVSITYDEYRFDVYADPFSEDISYLAFAIYPGRYVFISTTGASGGIFRSSDGENWSSVSENLPSLNDDQFWAILNIGANVFAGNPNEVLYKSTDNGKSWTEIELDEPMGITNLIYYKGIILGCNANGEMGYILRSEDEGETFSKVSIGISAMIRRFFGYGDYLFIGTTYRGVYRSSDNGISWTEQSTGLDSLFITDFHSNDEYLFVTTLEGGVYRSSDKGDSWTAVNTGLPDENGVCVITIEQIASYLFVSLADNGAGTAQGVYRSSDNGENWEDVSDGLTELEGMLYAFGDNLLFGSVTTLFSSSDNGDSWEVVSTFTGEGINFATGDSANELYVDSVSIKKKSNTIFDDTDDAGTEMEAELGYYPTKSLVMGWDQVLARRGRIYYLNPFIVNDKRYENYLLVSHIHSDGSYQWDMSSFGNYRELERFDSNQTVGIVLLSTMDILILKDASISVLSDDGTAGTLREPVFGIDCISTNSIVNANGIIYWCGGEDIYMLNIAAGFSPKQLLKETIRDLYLDLSDKDSLFAIRDRFNSYRLRTYKSEDKTEYLLTENGWVEEVKNVFPEIYRAGFHNRLYFLANGVIYLEETELDYNSVAGIIMSNEFVTDES